MAVPPPSSDPAKLAMRKQLREQRAAHVAAIGKDGEIAAAEAAARHLLDHIPAGTSISLYIAMHDELDPAPLAEALHRRGHQIAMPALFDDTAMRFLAWRPGDPLERGPMRLRQPHASQPDVAPDIVVTPLLGFDLAGNRIGYGAGHYDRAFQRFAGARRLGFAWAMQETAHIPHDPWDVPLHAVATEQGFLPL